MNDGKIPTKPHPVPVSHHQPGAGVIQISQSSRPTEEIGLAAYEGSIQHEATDTTTAMAAQGLFRCSVDGQWLPREAFSPDARKRNGLQSICKHHRAAHERQKAAREYLEQQAQMRYAYRKRMTS